MFLTNTHTQNTFHTHTHIQKRHIFFLILKTQQQKNKSI